MDNIIKFYYDDTQEVMFSLSNVWNDFTEKREIEFDIPGDDIYVLNEKKAQDLCMWLYNTLKKEIVPNE